MQTPPIMNGFRPFGVPAQEADSVILLFEEYESLRLADYDNLTQEEAAEKMQVSRPTFARIYDKARKVIAKAFVEGKAIFIEGGNVNFEKDWFRCRKCNHTFISGLQADNPQSCPKCKAINIVHINTSLNRPDTDKPTPTEDSGLKLIVSDCAEEKTCVCVNCGEIEMEGIKVPCRMVDCPKCGQPLMRKDSYQYSLMKQRGLIE